MRQAVFLDEFAHCGAQGDVVTFVKAVRRFARNHDALKFLDERAGHDLPKARPLGDDHFAAILKLAQEMKGAEAEYYAERLQACRDEGFTCTRDGAEHTTTVPGCQTGIRGHS